MTPLYSTGAVSLVQGQRGVVGIGTKWGAVVPDRTYFSLDGQFFEQIDRITGDGSLQLALPWPRLSATAASYGIWSPLPIPGPLPTGYAYTSGAAGLLTLTLLTTDVFHDLSGGPGLLILPPAGVVTRRVKVFDYVGTGFAYTNNLVMQVAGGAPNNTINGETEFVFNIDGQSQGFADNGTSWNLD